MSGLGARRRGRWCRLPGGASSEEAAGGCETRSKPRSVPGLPQRSSPSRRRSLLRRFPVTLLLLPDLPSHGNHVIPVSETFRKHHVLSKFGNTRVSASLALHRHLCCCKDAKGKWRYPDEMPVLTQELVRLNL
ncbi:uncharacterized protein FN964_000127 isoform 1-T1 [Alca torda]